MLRQVNKFIPGALIAVGLIMSLGAGAVFPFYNVFLSEVGATSGQIGLVFAGAWTIAAVVTEIRQTEKRFGLGPLARLRDVELGHHCSKFLGIGAGLLGEPLGAEAVLQLRPELVAHIGENGPQLDALKTWRVRRSRSSGTSGARKTFRIFPVSAASMSSIIL